MHSLIGLYSPYVGTKARCLQEKELLRLPFDNCYLYGHPSSSFDSKAKVFVASNVATDHLYRVELDVDDCVGAVANRDHTSTSPLWLRLPLGVVGHLLGNILWVCLGWFTWIIMIEINMVHLD